MEFTCHMIYHQKALTAMARAVRKTIRAKASCRAHIFSWIVILVTLGTLYLSWGTPWKMVINGVVLAVLLLVNWKEDAINGYVGKRSAMPGTDCVDITFHPDCYVVVTPAAESRWQYDKISALAETKEYIVFVFGKNHALAVEKAVLEGGSVEEFRRFIEEKTAKKIQNIGR